jgi:hypothetical protein
MRRILNENHDALICPEAEHAGGEGKVHRREGLGGPLNHYHRKAT